MKNDNWTYCFIFLYFNEHYWKTALIRSINVNSPYLIETSISIKKVVNLFFYSSICGLISSKSAFHLKPNLKIISLKFYASTNILGYFFTPKIHPIKTIKATVPIPMLNIRNLTFSSSRK